MFSIIRIFPSPKQRHHVLEILHSVQDLTRPIPGCLGCWISEDDVLHNHVRYAEQWDSDTALYEHIRSALYLRLLTAMELSNHPPQVRFHFCSETKGFELVEEVRGEARLPEFNGTDQSK